MKIIPCLMFVFAVAAWLGGSVQAGPPGSGFGGVLDATYMIENQEVPVISGISLGVDTSASGDGGKAAAFIKSIEFLE